MFTKRGDHHEDKCEGAGKTTYEKRYKMEGITIISLIAVYLIKCNFANYFLIFLFSFSNHWNSNCRKNLQEQDGKLFDCNFKLALDE